MRCLDSGNKDLNPGRRLSEISVLKRWFNKAERRLSTRPLRLSTTVYAFRTLQNETGSVIQKICAAHLREPGAAHGDPARAPEVPSKDTVPPAPPPVSGKAGRSLPAGSAVGRTLSCTGRATQRLPFKRNLCHHLYKMQALPT